MYTLVTQVFFVFVVVFLESNSRSVGGITRHVVRQTPVAWKTELFRTCAALALAPFCLPGTHRARGENQQRVTVTTPERMENIPGTFALPDCRGGRKEVYLPPLSLIYNIAFLQYM